MLVLHIRAKFWNFLAVTHWQDETPPPFWHCVGRVEGGISRIWEERGVGRRDLKGASGRSNVWFRVTHRCAILSTATHD